MLIRCCGNLLVEEEPQGRKDILEQVWMKVKTCCELVNLENPPIAILRMTKFSEL